MNDQLRILIQSLKEIPTESKEWSKKFDEICYESLTLRTDNIERERLMKTLVDTTKLTKTAIKKELTNRWNEIAPPKQKTEIVTSDVLDEEEEEENFDDKVPLVQYRTGDSFLFEWFNNGILMRQTRRKNTTRDFCWKWNSFQLDYIYDGEFKNFLAYDFTINGVPYQYVSSKHIASRLSNFNPLRNWGHILEVMIEIYARKLAVTIPHRFYGKYCGFTSDGFQLPDKFHFPASTTETIQNIHKNILLLAGPPILPFEETKQRVLNLYNATHIRMKDLLFAWGCISLLETALLPYTNVRMWFALFAPDGSTGKTKAAKSVTFKFWNNMDGKKEVLSKDNAISESRLQEYLASDTFPKVIDDCGDLGENCMSTIKTYCTEESGFYRKAADQSVKINAPLISPLAFTFNIVPLMFFEEAFLTRGVIILANRHFTAAETQEYLSAFNNLPNGAAGQYIIHCLQERFPTFKDLLDLFDQMPSPPNHFKDRQRPIWKLLCMGATLFQLFFGQALDIQKLLPEAFEYMDKLGDEELFSFVIEMRNCLEAEDGSKPKWLKTGTFEAVSINKEPAYTFSADAYYDICGFLRKPYKEKLSFETIEHNLQKRWPGTKYKNVRTQQSKSPVHQIVIPKCDIDMTNPLDLVQDILAPDQVHLELGEQILCEMYREEGYKPLDLDTFRERLKVDLPETTAEAVIHALLNMGKAKKFVVENISPLNYEGLET
jgi:hypothetical protein